MALKKNFSTSSRYYYAVINRVDIGKNAARFEYGAEHLIQVLLTIRDEKDKDFFIVENTLHYTVPSLKTIQKPVLHKVPKIDPKTGEEVKTKSGKTVLVEVQNGVELAIDESYRDPFTVDRMLPQGENIFKLVYEWLKANIELFADFEDC